MFHVEQRSEHWAFGGVTVSTGESVGTGVLLAKNLQARKIPRFGDHSKEFNAISGPTIRLIRWLTDHKSAPESQQGSGTFGNRRWWSERTGRGDIEGTPVIRVATNGLSPSQNRRDPSSPAQKLDGFGE